MVLSSKRHIKLLHFADINENFVLIVPDEKRGRYLSIFPGLTVRFKILRLTLIKLFYVGQQKTFCKEFFLIGRYI